MSWDKQFDKDSSDMGSDYYKFKDGINRVRIMSAPTIKVTRWGYGICYEGAPYCQKAALEADEKRTGKEQRLSKKWECWAIVRGDAKKGSDDRFVILSLPYAVAVEVRNLKVNPEYEFEEFPMPYDIAINVKEAGTMNVKYSVQAARKNTPVTEEELKEFEDKTPIETILEKMKEKARAKQEGGAKEVTSDDEPGTDVDDINPDDIPF